VAALSLLLPSTLTYDPWTWVGWGRDLAGLELDTSQGPAVKPLPVLAGALLSPFGDAAPWLWLVVARAGALLSAVLAFRLARRLGGGSVAAGAVAFGGVALCDRWLWHGWLGNSEGVFLALVLVAALRALDGRHRAALVLGWLAALTRLEAAPFWLVYCGWVWRRDFGARVWIAAALAALPVAWLGPDLVGSGDPFRSSERARIPNPGAPALAERPALESLQRAVALAPAVVWAGALLALAGVWRRELPRLAALPLAAGAAWVGLVALMAELGYSGEERYAMPGIALAAISAGAGAGWAATDASGRGRFGAALVAAVLLAPMAAQQYERLVADARGARYEADLYGSLDDAVARAGGRAAVLRCRPVQTARYSRPALAWRLHVAIADLSTQPARSGTVFRARSVRGSPPSPRLRSGPLREVARAGRWAVLSSC
jgi:hypothetical protein